MEIYLKLLLVVMINQVYENAELNEVWAVMTAEERKLFAVAGLEEVRAAIDEAVEVDRWHRRLLTFLELDA